MNIHEFQAKKILQKYGIPITDFVVIDKIDELPAILKQKGWEKAVVKVQVHAGGRGKAGGVKLAKSREEILSAAKALLGMKIVNEQTGPEGLVSHQVLITPTVDFVKEYYVGAVIDRTGATPMLIVSPEGGTEIEVLAEESPDRILSVPISRDGTIKGFRLSRVLKFMGWRDEMAKKGAQLIKGLCKAFIETDASLLEINPLVETRDGDLIALDAKLSIDDNAIYRQPELASFFDPTQISPSEVRAKASDLSYIALQGNIGCMVNGAGLAMATMDIIKHYGGMPSNFLDVGGSATEEKVAEGFKLILSDPQVKAILVNIFGGIMNCETLALGIIAAAKELHVHVPLVVRMEGTNVEKGRKVLAESGLAIIIANDFAEAAKKVVAEAVKKK
jgi:succinyl-CoA synthetase beta subunit